MKTNKNEQLNKEKDTGLPPPKTWRCRECAAILGFLSKDEETIMIKYKDLLVHVSGGLVKRTCRSCGSWNQLSQKPIAA